MVQCETRSQTHEWLVGCGIYKILDVGVRLGARSRRVRSYGYFIKKDKFRYKYYINKHHHNIAQPYYREEQCISEINRGSENHWLHSIISVNMYCVSLEFSSLLLTK
jgi:hypothetical protein